MYILSRNLCLVGYPPNWLSPHTIQVAWCRGLNVFFRLNGWFRKIHILVMVLYGMVLVAKNLNKVLRHTRVGEVEVCGDEGFKKQITQIRRM